MRGSFRLRWLAGRPARSASVAVVVALVATIGVVVVDGVGGAAAWSLGGVVFVALGVFAGAPALALIGNGLQLLGATVAVVAGAGDEARYAAVALGLLVWLAAEASWSALEHRRDAQPTVTWRARRVVDLSIQALVAGAVGIAALALAAEGPSGGDDLRLAALGVVVVVLAVVWWVSRARGRGAAARR